MKKIICICICICISLTAGCGKQAQTKPLPQPAQQMAVKKLAPLGNNKESASVEKLQEEASEVLETSKSYLESGYGFARNHW
ncbi:hypothetical protein, partial [Candidatus Endomicrobiellum agilis]|uniref:hypothetical protein n=1 Tax=Candidatus Endomicrobiellum agilis TaxID=3238957 RepID=UPI0035762CD8|nr:hypothetical protein [Endomicrobium sp.]